MFWIYTVSVGSYDILILYSSLIFFFQILPSPGRLSTSDLDFAWQFVYYYSAFDFLQTFYHNIYLNRNETKRFSTCIDVAFDISIYYYILLKPQVDFV